VYGHKTGKIEQFEGTPTHFNISLMLAKYLGYSTKTEYSKPLKDYTILGNDIDGFAGRMKLELEDGQVKSEKVIRDL
ncbi:MAG: hypothetical protein KC478_16080, partial [Bacteriovoracaceae bacterium]|nr:hypothetical protein [Bacteriovoracaceae bacterium]